MTIALDRHGQSGAGGDARGNLGRILSRRASEWSRRILHLPHAHAGKGSRQSLHNIFGETLAKEIEKQVRAEIDNIFGGAAPKQGGADGKKVPTPEGSQMPGSPLGNQSLELVIDRMVAAVLMHGQHTSGVMRVLFGLAPSLIGR